VRLPKPNKQVERYWAPCGKDPQVKTSTRNQGEKKVMCWAGRVDEHCIIIWFEGDQSVNGDTYLEML
jgi:hypothetical protein